MLGFTHSSVNQFAFPTEEYSAVRGSVTGGRDQHFGESKWASSRI